MWRCGCFRTAGGLWLAGVLRPPRHADGIGRADRAQLPGLQPAGRPAARLDLSARRQAGGDPRGGNLDCNDGELLFDWVKQGLGIGWRSTWEIQAELKRGELVTVLDEYALPAYDIQAVYPQQRYLPAKVRFFIDYLKDIYNAPGYWEVR
jgi:Transcriptional regulator